MSNLSVEPQTVVKLLRCGLQRNSGHQLTFTDATAQHTYFESRVLYTYTDFTYVRDNNSITVGDNLDSIRDCNYLMYQNTGFANKWFYAFITDLEYVNENCTRVYFDTDSWQTWQWDFDYHTCWVEREHTNDDTIGANTVPENLETGEYICLSTQRYNGFNDLIYVAQVTKDWNKQDLGCANYGGLPMAGGAYICSTTGAFLTLINHYNNSRDSSGQPDLAGAIYNCYVIPRNFINISGLGTGTDGTHPGIGLYYTGTDDPTYRNDDININKMLTPGEDTSWQPKNNKLKTYPYVYLVASNNNGVSNVYKYEDFNDNYCTFTVKGVPTPGGSFKLVPTDSYLAGEDEGIMAGKFPTLNWSEDGYTNWLTQNGVNLSYGIQSKKLEQVAGGVMALGGIATGNFFGAISGLSTVAMAGTGIEQSMATFDQHRLIPDTAVGNTNGGDINVCSSRNTFIFYNMSIKTSFAKSIDDFFSMYGYKTNRRKRPNITGRASWNYVKTIGCNFDAKNSSKMSREDEIKIQQMFDNGVTLWHDPATMYDYGQLNFIV